jgi:hypothetical protein
VPASVPDRFEQSQSNPRDESAHSDARDLDAIRGAVERLLPIVFGDHRVRDRLLSAPDPAEFERRTAEVAAAHGIELSPAEIGTALDSARRRWLERPR